jgi:hypothetical protein
MDDTCQDVKDESQPGPGVDLTRKEGRTFKTG